MTPVLKRALLSGSMASVTTTVWLACAARLRGRRYSRASNVTAHWVHGVPAFYTARVNARHTALGYGIHHAACILWAYAFEAARTARRRPALLDATAVCFLAAFADYAVAPYRLRPGWEAILPVRSIAGTYVVMAATLAALDARRRAR